MIKDKEIQAIYQHYTKNDKLIFVREPQNEYDKNAIKVYMRLSTHWIYKIRACGKNCFLWIAANFKRNNNRNNKKR